MQNIEEQALATYTGTIPLWLSYVDDTFTAVHKEGIDDFQEHLDCLVTRENNKLQMTIYRKPTHIDRLLDQSSYKLISHKATQDFDETSTTSLRFT